MYSVCEVLETESSDSGASRQGAYSVDVPDSYSVDLSAALESSGNNYSYYVYVLYLSFH